MRIPAGKRLRSAALGAAVFALLAAAPALGAFPGSDPDESVRQNTPNDPGFDPCEPDNPGGSTCSNVFSQEIERFGFSPTGAQNTARYNNCPAGPILCTDAHTKRLEEQNQAAGRSPSGQVSGVSADRAWKRSIGVPDVEVAILDTGIRWNNRGLRKKIAINEDELPRPRDGATDCAADDCNGDGAFDVDDYADDPRVGPTDGNAEADAFLDASDLIAAFSNGTDEGSNG
ncbi:MAG: hypothetical protein H0V85_06885, partial [Thermoleophilaceae bacterium]|nr:hypothetical protein [Thermoleophilaceae bacterium]